jgi:hypothetical protein
MKKRTKKKIRRLREHICDLERDRVHFYARLNLLHSEIRGLYKMDGELGEVRTRVDQLVEERNQRTTTRLGYTAGDLFGDPEPEIRPLWADGEIENVLCGAPAGAHVIWQPRKLDIVYRLPGADVDLRPWRGRPPSK